MSDWSNDFNEYDSTFDGPEAKLNRAAYEAEQRAVRAIDAFLATLGPQDAQMDLFSFTEISEWGLKHTRKRARE